MKRARFLWTFSFLCIFSFINIFASESDSMVTIDKISVQSDINSAKIILESNLPLPVPNAFYDEENPSTIIIDLGRAKITQDLYKIEKSPEIEEIDFITDEADKTYLRINLKERHFFRIYSDQKSMVIELHPIQEDHGEYLYTPQAREELEKNNNRTIYLNEIAVFEDGESINITAKVTNEVTPNIFVLNNPLRLVVDFCNTVNLCKKYFNQINKSNLETVTASQFQFLNPHKIARMTFYLSQPKFYSVNYKNKEMTISLHADSIFHASPAIASPDSGNSQPNIDPEPSPPEQIIDPEPSPQEHVDPEAMKIQTEDIQKKTFAETTPESPEKPIANITQKSVPQEQIKVETINVEFEDITPSNEFSSFMTDNNFTSSYRDIPYRIIYPVAKTTPKSPEKAKPNNNHQEIPQEQLEPEAMKTQTEDILRNEVVETIPESPEKPQPNNNHQEIPQEQLEPEAIKTQTEDIPRKKEKESQEPSTPPEPKTTQKSPQEKQIKTKTLAEAQIKYRGEPISPKFKDADLRDVILSICESFGLNVVFDPEVKGTVTCDFKDIPWDQFIEIILKINRMGKITEGNVLRVAPIDILTKEERDERTLEVSKELAEPIQVRTFTLSYSKADKVREMVAGKLSDRGEIIVDVRTNTLVVSDVKDRIEIIEKLINVFDAATPQVSIEARIVEATSNFIRNLGVQWGWRGVADPFYGNQTSLSFPNKILNDGAMIPQGTTTRGIGGPLGGYAINLPAPAFSSAVGFSFSNILDTFRLDMALSALETSGEGKIISRPNVTTQNNQEAEIIQGRQIPVQTTANFTTTTRYQNAALELKATPQITAEGTIIMVIEIKNNAPDWANLVNGIPPILTQSAKTTVTIPDGGTTVIGGIHRTQDAVTREKVPFLHKIPLLGNLFRSFSRTQQTRELIIFITPRII